MNAQLQAQPTGEILFDLPVQFANTTFPGTQPAIAIPSKPHSPAAVGWVPTFPDPPAWDEVVTDYAARRGE